MLIEWDGQDMQYEKMTNIDRMVCAGRKNEK
jgi:hypothetical protein